MKNDAYINPYKLFIGAFVPNWLLERKKISHGAKLCYARLCQYAGKKAVCFPSQEELSQELGTNKRQIRRFLIELQDLKLIEVDRIGLKCTNRYRFLKHEWMSKNIMTEAELNKYKDEFREDNLSSQEVPDLSSQEVPDLSSPRVRESEVRESRVRESRAIALERLKISFENFWSIYPKKCSKGQAEKAWLKIMSGESPVEERIILQAVLRAKTSADWRKDDGRYIPYPATWLNARGWEDEIQTGKEGSEDARFNFLKRHQKAGSGIQTPAVEPGHT